MNTPRFLDRVRTLAITCTQWGDSGKGKLVDYFADWADIIGRGTGGANAGHTITIGPRTYVVHLIPSGILRDGDGKVNIIGNGVAFDPRVFAEELNILKREDVSFNHLYVAHNARLVLPQHILMDLLRESSSEGRIGTTGRGVGPAYVDHYARVGLTVNDLLNVDCLGPKVQRNLKEKRRLLAQADPELVKRIMHHERLECGMFWHPTRFVNEDAVVERLRGFGADLRSMGMVRDTDQMMKDAVDKKRLLLEGAQGNLLSIDYGTYPYVTAAECSVQGLARGLGIREREVDLALGVVKAFYMTRVGGGPFPTELGGQESDKWCNHPDTTHALEDERYPKASVNSANPFHQGIGIRRAGGEYGATTGRPRRVGWLDLPLLRYSVGLSDPNVALTKLDVLDQCRTIKVCTHYHYRGPSYAVGERILTDGCVIETAIPDSFILARCVPTYASFKGWQESIREARTVSALPDRLKRLLAYLGFFASNPHLNIMMVSVGPDRDQTIVMDNC